MPLYFAYGSNMSTARLKARAPSAARQGLAELRGHDLRFHKRGTDGSGKADAFLTGRPEDVVWGVLFDLSEADLSAVDSAEGEGEHYERRPVDVRTESGSTVRPWTYLALEKRIAPSLRPLPGYMDHVLRGGREHGLPAEYIRRLESVECMSGR